MAFFPSQTTKGLNIGTLADKYAQQVYPTRKKAGFFPQPKLLTPSQQELIPYLQREAEKKAKKKGLLQPVEALFNLLNRGQFLTAGIAQRILKNIEQDRPAMEDMPQTIKEAVTGKVQYDWEVVLFGGKHKGGEEYGGIAPWEPTTGAGKFGKGAAGFLANVLLDPLTYVGFGAASGARIAATKYSDDVVKFAIRGIGKDAKEVLPEMIQKGFSKKAFAEKLGKSLPDALQYMQKYSGGDITKFYSKLHKAAYKEALRKPTKELTEPLLKEFEKEFQERAGRGLIKAPKIPKGVKRLPGKVGEEDYLKKTIEYLKTDPYSGAGQRAGRFMRKEFVVGERYPDWLKTMDKLKSRFAESKIGGTFSDAWWGLMNNPKSPVATLRKMFRVRNPYQKLLSIMERDIVAETSHSMVLKGEKIRGVVDDLTDAERQAVTGSMVWSQIMQEQAGKSAQVVPMRASEIIQKYGKDIDIDKVMKSITEINTMTDEWLKFNKWAYDRGLSSDIGQWMDYLPEQFAGKAGWKKSGTQLGVAQPAFGKARKAGWSGNIKAQVEKIKWMFGMDEEVAYKVLKGGGGDLNLDLQDMLMRRAFAQTRFEQRINMVDSFREFGVNLDDIKNLPEGEDIYRSLAGKWGQLEQLGLKPIDAKGLEGHLFDREVADILERAINVNSNDKTLQAAAKALSSFTSWWRGWATLSPGFHARNFYSNNMTGFLKHGVEWFEPKVHLEAFVGTVIGLHGIDDGIKRLSQIMPNSLVKEVAARRIGNHTLAELADWGGSKGIITRMSRGYGQPESFKDLVKMEGKLFENLNLNPLSSKNIAMKGSRNLGSYIESTARFQSFLLDIRRGVKQGANMQSAMDFGKMEAKKFFLDYSDLSEFERKVMKNVIPFYCVPVDCEILTRNGWKLYNEIEINKTEVLAYDIKTDTSFWKPLKGVAVFDYDGILMSLRNKTGGEFLFTPDHKWPVFSYCNYKTEKIKKIVKGYELCSMHRIPLVADKTEWPGKCLVTIQEAKIIGWLLTDGSMNQRSGNFWQYVIYQKKSDFVQEIRELLNGECSEYIHPITGTIRFELNGKLRKQMQELLKNKTDNIQLITRLNKECAEAMWDAMYKGDGTIVKERDDRPETKTDMFFAAQEDTVGGKAVGDCFQILSIMLNKVAHKTQNRRGMYIRKKKERRFMGIGKDRAALGTEWFKGKIWCPELDGLCWMMRRNGKHILTSNTWLRGNISVQLIGLMQFPEMYGLLPKATQALTAKGGPEREELPDWVRELGMFPIGGEEGRPRMFWPNFPYQDINKIPVKFQMDEDTGFPVPVAESPWDMVSDIAADAHPLIKSLIQVIPKEGVDIFYQEPLGETRKAPRALRLLTKSEGLLGFLDGMMRRAGFEEGMRIDVNKKGQLIMDAKMAKVLEDNILPLRMIPQYLDLPELMFPVLEDWKRKVTGAVDDYEAVEEFLQTLSFYAGVKMKDIELKDYRFRQNEELLEKAQAAKRKAARKMPGAEARSQAWKQGRVKYQRRYGL